MFSPQFFNPPGLVSRRRQSPDSCRWGAHYIAVHLIHPRLEQAYGLGDLAEGCNLFAESKNCRLFFLDRDHCFRVRTFRRILSALMAISVSGLCRRTANFAGACICRPAAATKAAGVHGAYLPTAHTQIRISQSHNKNLLKFVAK